MDSMIFKIPKIVSFFSIKGHMTDKTHAVQPIQMTHKTHADDW
jgi:hypothetical protein